MALPVRWAMRSAREGHATACAGRPFVTEHEDLYTFDKCGAHQVQPRSRNSTNNIGRGIPNCQSSSHPIAPCSGLRVRELIFCSVLRIAILHFIRVYNVRENGQCTHAWTHPPLAPGCACCPRPSLALGSQMAPPLTPARDMEAGCCGGRSSG
jgi:hypothetical protein